MSNKIPSVITMIVGTFKDGRNAYFGPGDGPWSEFSFSVSPTNPYNVTEAARFLGPYFGGKEEKDSKGVRVAVPLKPEEFLLLLKSRMQETISKYPDMLDEYPAVGSLRVVEYEMR